MKLNELFDINENISIAANTPTAMRAGGKNERTKKPKKKKQPQMAVPHTIPEDDKPAPTPNPR